MFAQLDVLTSCLTSETVIPEFQLVSEQASCLFLDEIYGRYFLVLCKVDDVINS